MNSLEAKGKLGAASLYFYLGYYSGMRYSVNHMRSSNPLPIEESEDIRILIEVLPTEVAALRFGANPEMAMLRIAQLIFGEISSNSVEPEVKRGLKTAKT
jgi:hypothetical protein